MIRIIIFFGILGAVPCLAQEVQWAKGQPGAEKSPSEQMWYVQVKKDCGFTVGYGSHKNQPIVLACHGDIQDARKCFDDYQRNIQRNSAKTSKPTQANPVNCRWKGAPEILEQKGNEGCEIGIGVAICGEPASAAAGKADEKSDSSNQPGAASDKAMNTKGEASSPGAQTSSPSATTDTSGAPKDSLLPSQDSAIQPPPGTTESIIACQAGNVSDPSRCYQDTSVNWQAPPQKSNSPNKRPRRKSSNSGSAF